MEQLFAYLITDKFMFVIFKILLNIFSVVMLGGIAKSILKLTKYKDLHQKRRLILSVISLIIGGLIGFYLYPFTIFCNILIGTCSGYFSSVLYRILIKTIYKKFDINVTDNNENSESWSPSSLNSLKEDK